jgi:hypothetical protein
MIAKWYTTTFTVKRQTWSGDSSAIVTQGTFAGHIQQGTPENMQESLGFRFTKAYVILCPTATDIQEGDRIEEGGRTYDARFVVDRNIGANGHLEVIVEKNG